MNLEFGIGPGIYLCCHNYECYGQHGLGGGKRQLQVVIQGWLLINPAMCHLYWNGDGCDGHE